MRLPLYLPSWLIGCLLPWPVAFYSGLVTLVALYPGYLYTFHPGSVAFWSGRSVSGRSPRSNLRPAAEQRRMQQAVCSCLNLLPRLLCPPSAGVDIIEAGFPVASPDDFEAVRAIAMDVGNAVDDTGYVPVICGLSRTRDKVRLPSVSTHEFCGWS